MRRTIDGAKIRKLREERGETQEEFAVRSGVVRNTVARVEAGLPVQRTTVRAIAGALGVSEAELLADEVPA